MEIYANNPLQGITQIEDDHEYDFRVNDSSSIEQARSRFAIKLNKFTEKLERYSTLLQSIRQIDLTGLENESLKSFITGPGMSREVGSTIFDREARPIGKINATAKLLDGLFGETKLSAITNPDGTPSRSSQDSPHRRKAGVLHSLSLWLEDGLKNGVTIGDFMTEARKLLAATGASFENAPPTPATVPSQIRENFFGRFTAEEIRRVLLS